MSTPRKSLLWVSSVLAVLVGCAIVVFLIWSLVYEGQNFATLDSVNGRRVEIYVDRFPEATRGFAYEVWEGDALVVPRTFFLHLPIDEEYPTFRAKASYSGDVILVVRDATLGRIEILYDFATGFSYPRDAGEPELEDYLRKSGMGRMIEEQANDAGA